LHFFTLSLTDPTLDSEQRIEKMHQNFAVIAVSIGMVQVESSVPALTSQPSALSVPSKLVIKQHPV